MTAQPYNLSMTAQQLRAALATDINALYNAIGVAGADKFTTTPGQTVFVLSNNPLALANLDISLDGSTLVPTDDYAWDGNVTVTLTAGTLAGQRLLVRYIQGLTPGAADVFTATAGQTAFVLSKSPKSLNNLDVSLDGATLVPTDDYTWDGNVTLTLLVGALLGQRLLARQV